MKQKKLTIGHRFQFQRRWWPQVCKPMALIKASRKINKRAPVRRISEDDERLLLPDVPSGFEIRNCYFHRLPSGDAIAATGYRLFNDAVTLTVRADCVRIFTHRTLKFSFLRWWRLWCWVIDVSAKDLALWWRSVALLCFGSVSRVGRVWKQAISVTDLLPNSPCRTHRLVHVHETPPGGREVEKMQFKISFMIFIGWPGVNVLNKSTASFGSNRFSLHLHHHLGSTPTRTKAALIYLSHQQAKISHLNHQSCSSERDESPLITAFHGNDVVMCGHDAILLIPVIRHFKLNWFGLFGCVRNFFLLLRVGFLRLFSNGRGRFCFGNRCPRCGRRRFKRTVAALSATRLLAVNGLMIGNRIRSVLSVGN